MFSENHLLISSLYSLLSVTAGYRPISGLPSPSVTCQSVLCQYIHKRKYYQQYYEKCINIMTNTVPYFRILRTNQYNS